MRIDQGVQPERIKSKVTQGLKTLGKIIAPPLSPRSSSQRKMRDNNRGGSILNITKCRPRPDPNSGSGGGKLRFFRFCK